MSSRIVMVECIHCGKIFPAKSRKAKYCSKKCHDITFRIKHGIPCNPNVEPYHKICAVCGNPFDSFRDTAVTCSHTCALRYSQRNDPSVPREPRKKENTTEIWVNQKHGDLFRYVSHAHRRIKLQCKCCNNIIERHVSAVRRFNTECEHCKEQHELTEARQKMMRFFNALAESKVPKKCERCGAVFFSQYSNQKYCSKKCKGKGHRQKGTYRSRCRHYGVFYDPSVTRAKVIRRDNGTCRICGKVCNENDRSWGSFGPDFPTVDHIIPLAKGGTHTWDNVQCACAMCNSDKRDLLGYA